MNMTSSILLISLLLAIIEKSHPLILTSGQRIPSRQSIHQHASQNARLGPKSFFDLPAIEKFATDNDLKEHHLKGLYRVLMNADRSTLERTVLEEQLHALSFPKKQISSLLSTFSLTCSIQRIEKSKGGAKFVVQLPNGKLIESVLIRHERHNGDVRYTTCVSSQIGCAKKCSFCATGTMGLVGQLSSAEILEQIYLLQQYVKEEKLPGQVGNVVFMGMGEPLDNYDAVHEALRGITHQCLFGLKAKKVTVSTVGASAQKIRALADEAPQVCLALSLHSAIQSSREVLIPSAISSHIDDLGDALDYHACKSGGRGAMLEYLLIDGINDSNEEARALTEFCLKREGSVYVNLIPYNPTLAGDDFGFRTPLDGRINAFHENLKESGVKALVRWSTQNGRDANGACGQLALSSTA
jgi:adenine C2-methylase RlmN of 23S rRNA A2503 and tRNA A37